MCEGSVVDNEDQLNNKIFISLRNEPKIFEMTVGTPSGEMKSRLKAAPTVIHVSEKQIAACKKTTT
jgi:hypothetical protein